MCLYEIKLSFVVLLPSGNTLQFVPTIKERAVKRKCHINSGTNAFLLLYGYFKAVVSLFFNCDWGVNITVHFMSGLKKTNKKKSILYHLQRLQANSFFNHRNWWHLWSSEAFPRPRKRLTTHRLMCATGVCPAHSYCHGDRPFEETSPSWDCVLLLFLLIKMDYQVPPHPSATAFTHAFSSSSVYRGLWLEQLK